jgi:hypothetical protein
MTTMDLYDYRERFHDALQARYGDTFDEGFRRIAIRYQDVASGKRPLVVEDVMEIFAEDLPYCQDWSKPDQHNLHERMRTSNVADRIRRMGGVGYPSELITEIWRCFRDLSLTSLVLHHVYPDRFAMCSHHLASLLNISATTVPSFYINYCQELRLWSERGTPTESAARWKARNRRRFTVVDTEFALWTWYRFAFIKGMGNNKEHRRHRTNFFRDPWVQDRKAEKISESLGVIGKLDLARSYIRIQPTVAAMIAWRELEVEVRRILNDGRRATGESYTFRSLIEMLPTDAFSRDLTKEDVLDLRGRRNAVMHEGEEIACNEEEARLYAKKVVSGISAFVEKNRRGVEFPSL